MAEVEGGSSGRRGWRQWRAAADSSGCIGGLRLRQPRMVAADGGGQQLWRLLAVSEDSGGVSDVITYKNSVRREKKCYS